MKYFWFFIISVALTVNLYTAPFSPQKGGNCYTLDIPDYMARTYQLNDVATLQYQNLNKDAYCIVIEDSKEHLESVGMKFVDTDEFLDGFLETYMIDEQNRKVSEYTNFKSNGNKHSQAELSWSSVDGNFYMLVTAVETKNHFYKILCWTGIENKDKLYDDFIKISKSLKD